MQYREKPLDKFDEVRDEIARRNGQTPEDWHRVQELVSSYKET